MSYLPHQIEKGDKLRDKLRALGVAYLVGAPRSGKTRTALYTCEHFDAARILVATKKAAIPGWLSEIAASGAAKNYTVTNYEQVKKLTPADYDLVIVDEAHNLARVGKPSQRFIALRRVAARLPVLLLSGTPAVERRAGFYYQFSVTAHSPFKQRNFYEFFREYGIPHQIRINGNLIEQHDRTRPELLQTVEPHIVRMTQEDAGISVKAVDVVHKISLSASTKDLLARAVDDRVLTVDGRLHALESDMAVRAFIHQAESGAVLVDDKICILGNLEIVDYIKASFPTGSLALMAHYRSTRRLLSAHFPGALILSSDGHAEGVDLSHIDNLVIVNSGYSGAKFIQRRERGVNINNKTDATVHHITTDAGISRLVYSRVSEKLDFNLAMFRRAIGAAKNTRLPQAARVVRQNNQHEQGRNA